MFTVKSVHEGNWGDWGNEIKIPDGYFLKGIRTRTEKSIDSGDDTALNGVEMICEKFDGGDQFRALVHPGFWGAWGSDMLVPENCYVIGMSIRNERSIGSGDDTAMNGIVLIYRNFDSDVVGKLTAEGGQWGTWLGDIVVDGNQYVCGLQARVELPQGDGDDTAMNGIRLLVNRLPESEDETGVNN